MEPHTETLPGDAGDDGLTYLMHLVEYHFPEDLPGRPAVGDVEVHTWITQVGSRSRDHHYLEKTRVWIRCFDCEALVLVDLVEGRLQDGAARCQACHAAKAIEDDRLAFDQLQRGFFCADLPDRPFPRTSVVYWASLFIPSPF